MVRLLWNDSERTRKMNGRGRITGPTIEPLFFYLNDFVHPIAGLVDSKDFNYVQKRLLP